MANTFITPDTVARMALATLYNESVMLPMVYRDYDNDFTGQAGDTVTVRKPAVFTANTYNQAIGITAQNLTETSVDVTLDRIFDVSIAVRSTDYTLEIGDFQAQVIAPAMEAISQAVDSYILGLRADISQAVTATAFNASSNPHPTFALIDAARVLTSAKVPLTDRHVAIDEYLTAQWRRDALTHEADKVGDDGTALRRYGIAGGLHGFDAVVESNNIDDFEGVAFHRTAFAFVSRPLALPRGAANASVMSYKGLAVRVIYDYDITYKQDIISLDLLCGRKTMDATSAVVINPPSSS